MAKSFTAHGSAQLETAQVKLGSAAGQFRSASSDYIVTTDQLGTLQLGNGDWTIEFFVYFISHSAVSVMVGPYHTANRGYLVYYNTDNTLHFAYCKNGTDTSTDTGKAWTPSDNTWYHIAIVNHSTTITWYVDGSSIGTLALNSDVVNQPNSTDGFTVGADLGGTLLNANVDELRISSTARYTANFTPPSSEFSSDANTLVLLHFNGTNGSTTFTDSNNIAWTRSLTDNILIGASRTVTVARLANFFRSLTDSVMNGASPQRLASVGKGFARNLSDAIMNGANPQRLATVAFVRSWIRRIRPTIGTYIKRTRPSIGSWTKRTRPTI